MKSYLTKQEIIKSYKDAKNKIEQVEILAQLSATDVDYILDVLKEAGVYKGAYHICGRCGGKFPSIYKKMKNPLCPDCREVGREIAALEWKLKRNVAKIEQIGLENAKLREQIDSMKGGKK